MWDINGIKEYFRLKATLFRAGCVKYTYDEWIKITTDREVLETVRGLPILIGSPALIIGFPANNFHPPIENKQCQFVNIEIESLLKKGVVVESHHEAGEYTSPIFVTEKSDGGYRLILNLKKLNKLAEYKKFKMETIFTILCLIRPNCFMAKVVLHKNVLYKFTVLPNGYTEGPRKFIKALKPPLSNIRKQGVIVAGYFDDLITLAITNGVCIQNISKIISSLDPLGFVIHPKKSTFSPSQEIEFLGFLINLVTMTVSLTHTKKEANKEMCSLALSMKSVTIRFVPKTLGKLSSNFIAVPLGKLHYRNASNQRH